jgi:molybdopterin-containing oxidoreductase family membrane subunit
MPTEPNGRGAPVVAPGHTAESVTDQIGSIVLTRGTPLPWLAGFTFAFGMLLLLQVAIAYLFYKGVGIWGVMIPVAWGWAIVNFVWWIGIGHAGTLISAILLLLHQEWRTSINRLAEAMTIFAVACAGLFPILHLGRPWVFYFLFPYPDTMTLWPQWRSPLVWDVFAVSTYFTVSLLFWYVGLIPDFATLRDKTTRAGAQRVFGVLAMGWRGSARHWARYESVYLLLAGLATPLVVSVHTVVSFDFSVAIVPGWHSTIFPPYFVAGAIYSGFAIVLVLIIPVRAYYGLDDFITPRHLENMGKLMLATGLIVAYGYVMEFFTGWYSREEAERFANWNRAFGPYASFFWLLITVNIIVPQALWFKRIRVSPFWLFVIALCVNLGMWLERFVIVVVSLSRDYVPSAWGYYSPTKWDWATFLGSLGLFFTLFFLFIRLLPVISIFEMRALVRKTALPATGGEPHTGALEG